MNVIPFPQSIQIKIENAITNGDRIAIRTKEGELLIGLAESIKEDHVMIRQNDGVIFVPINEIKVVNLD